MPGPVGPRAPWVTDPELLSYQQHVEELADGLAQLMLQEVRQLQEAPTTELLVETLKRRALVAIAEGRIGEAQDYQDALLQLLEAKEFSARAV